MSERCIFCDLYAKNINILYKNEKVFILLDIRPLSHGHLLVLPVKHGEFLYDYQEEDLSDIMPTILKVVKLLNIKKFNILQNNGNMQSVPHVHFHIVPCVDENNRLKIDWKTVDIPSDYVQTNVAKLKEVFKALN